MKAHSLKAMPFAVANEKGTGIKFKFVTFAGKSFEFVCDPKAVPEIVARLLGASEMAAQAANQSEDYQSDPAEVVKWQVGLTRKRDMVAIALYPAPKTGIGFALAPEHSDTISSLLAAAAAMISPTTRDSLH